MNKTINYEALGMRIREKRIVKNYTQEKLGEMCDLSAAHIGHIERGTRILSVEVLFKIAQTLDVSVDYLLFDSVENSDIISSISATLKNCDKNRVDHFLNIVRILAENIDKL